MDTNNNGTTTTVLRTSRPLRKKRSSNRQSKRSTFDSEQSSDLLGPEKEYPNNVFFLYIQLNVIDKLPETAYPMELHLFHVKNTLQKMQEKYTKDTIIYQNEFSMNKPLFAMCIMQDDINDMNTFSDNPLVITLYQRIPRHRKGHLKTINKSFNAKGDGTGADYTETPSSTSQVDGIPVQSFSKTDNWEKGEAEGESEQGNLVGERLQFISRGNCDLLQLFQRRRFISNEKIYLYPQYKRLLRTPTSEKITTTTQWHMYSILPMLKNFNFNNLVFITLESIYNVPDELHERAADLGVTIAFRSKLPKENGDYHVLPICNYYSFSSQIISTQSTGIVWENIKRDYNSSKNFSSLQMETNMRIKLPRIFRQLLATPGVDLKTDQIDPLVDVALVNNSLHRFVLTEEMRLILESVIARNDYDLVVQLFKDTPENAFYEGLINPSIFVYPSVNNCRFATLLTPIFRPSVTRRTSIHNSTSSFPTNPSIGPMFASIKICFYQPITQRNEPLDTYNESVLKTSKLRRCYDFQDTRYDCEEDKNVVEELYRAFDNLISEVISFIVNREIKSVVQKRDYFCCQLGNLNNLLLKLCGADFNIRMPTKNNIEFRQMITHMYKELIDRIENQFEKCSWENICHCVTAFDKEQHRLIGMMDELRMMCIIGEPEMAKQIYEELKAGSNNQKFFNFYTFLNNVENLNFHSAAQFFVKAKDGSEDEYFPSLAKLYVNYMMDLQSKDEEIVNAAYSNMLQNLRIFAGKYNLEIDTWILLYCFYKTHEYLPGMEYARWKYENLCDVPAKTFSNAPRSLYELFLPNDFEISNTAGKTNLKFYQTFKLFARLGAYGFAEIVFAQISTDFTPVEAYLVTTTLKTLQGQIDDEFQIRQLDTDNNGELMLIPLEMLSIHVEVSMRPLYNSRIF
ncbi:uncharacterized protein [Drosophila tropicalis]|uniref:uncharacterized protein isoform X2 n=1 Tax=Drosophila tropicalis TaxID=46794 RepID=UPI0035AC2512